jgi:hypothetical protein
MAAIPEGLAAALSRSYRLERELGAGGMATVYLAEDLKHHRQVAIKVLRPDLAASLGAERFLREVGIAARLSHPHILGLFDSGEAGGFLYYVSCPTSRASRCGPSRLGAAATIAGVIARGQRPRSNPVASDRS